MGGTCLGARYELEGITFLDFGKFVCEKRQQAADRARSSWFVRTGQNFCDSS